MFAVAMGILGPLPGFLIYSFSPGANLLFGGISEMHYMLLWYFMAAVPMLGPFCLVAGLLGGVVIRLTQESPRPWLAGLAIFTLPLLAGIPLSFLWGKPEVWGSSIFWASFYSLLESEYSEVAAKIPVPALKDAIAG